MADKDPYIEAYNKFNNAIQEAKDSGQLSQDEMVEMVDTAFDDEVEEALGDEKPRRKKK